MIFSRNRCCLVFLTLSVGLAISMGFSLGADEASLGAYRSLLERSGFPENDETRRLLASSINAPALPAVETPFKINRQFSDGKRVQFEVRRAVRDWYLIFRNQRGEGLNENYPLWGRGNWIIKKDLLTGEFIQAKIFLQDDEESFVRLFPTEDGRSRLDVHLYGRRLGDDVLIAVPFNQLVLSSFARLVYLSESSVDWNTIFPNPDNYGYRLVENFVNKLRPYSDRIVEVADAAVDRGGRNVLIETGEPISEGIVTAGKAGLNCSGYVKWVADALYSGWTDSPGAFRLPLKVLREPSLRANRNPWSDSRSAVGEDARNNLEALLRDPRFGLDWNRNLARKIEEARLGRSISIPEWAQLDGGELAGIPYRQDLGYSLDDLDSVLYQLAAQRPGAVYFAAVNSRFVPEATLSDPNPLPLHQYWHVSILAPWFDNGEGTGDRGLFRIAVLDVGDVTESFLANPRLEGKPGYPESIRSRALLYARLGNDDSNEPLVPEVMVHLVRADVPVDFQPTSLPEARQAQ